MFVGRGDDWGGWGCFRHESQGDAGSWVQNEEGNGQEGFKLKLLINKIIMIMI